MNHLHIFGHVRVTPATRRVHGALQGASQGLLFSYFCIKCGNNMWVLSCQLVGRKCSAFACEIMVWIPNVGSFLPPRCSQRAFGNPGPGSRQSVPGAWDPVSPWVRGGEGSWLSLRGCLLWGEWGGDHLIDCASKSKPESRHALLSPLTGTTGFAPFSPGTSSSFLNFCGIHKTIFSAA